MNICTIWHDGEFLGVAKDYRSAVLFLINQRYIVDTDEIYIPEHNSYCRLNEYLGEDWVDIMADKWDRHEFNAFYDYWFVIEENYLYDYELI